MKRKLKKELRPEERWAAEIFARFLKGRGIPVSKYLPGADPPDVDFFVGPDTWAVEVTQLSLHEQSFEGKPGKPMSQNGISHSIINRAEKMCAQIKREHGPFKKDFNVLIRAPIPRKDIVRVFKVMKKEIIDSICREVAVKRHFSENTGYIECLGAPSGTEGAIFVNRGNHKSSSGNLTKARKSDVKLVLEKKLETMKQVSVKDYPVRIVLIIFQFPYDKYPGIEDVRSVADPMTSEDGPFNCVVGVIEHERVVIISDPTNVFAKEIRARMPLN